MAQIIYILSLIFFILIPFDGVIAFLSVSTGIEFLLAWEILLCMLIVYLAGMFFIIKGKLSRVSFDFSLDIFILMVFFIISALIGFINQGVIQTLWGIKTLLTPLFVLFPLFIISPKKFELFTNRIVKIYVLLYIPIFLVGLIEILYGVDLLREFALNYDRPLAKVVTLEGIFRSIATFREPYDFGFFALIVSIFSLCQLYRSKGQKIFHLLVIIIGIVGLIFSTSRTNIISFIYILITLSVILIFFRFMKSETKRFFSLISISFIIIFSIYIVYKYGHLLPGELHLLSSQSLEERTLVWNDAIVNFPINKPTKLFLGYGIGAVGAPQLKVNSYFYNPVDNVYLFFLISFGVIGTILILIPILLSVIKTLAQVERQNWLQFSFLLVLLMLFFMQGFFVTFAEGLLSWSVCWLAVFYLRSCLIPERIR